MKAKGANKLVMDDLVYSYKKTVLKGSISIADSPKVIKDMIANS